jgi:hypothetical protein
MSMHPNFDEALAEFRQSGGAMNYHCAMPDAPEAWQVCDGKELEEQIEGTAREATESALAEGGMSDDEIAAELSDWAE